MVAVLMMSTKLATLGLLKVKAFSNISYKVIVFVNYVTDNILSLDSNYDVDLVI